jgi:hypothetical protein
MEKIREQKKCDNKRQFDEFYEWQQTVLTTAWGYTKLPRILHEFVINTFLT